MRSTFDTNRLSSIVFGVAIAGLCIACVCVATGCAASQKWLPASGDDVQQATIAAKADMKAQIDAKVEAAMLLLRNELRAEFKNDIKAARDAITTSVQSTGISGVELAWILGVIVGAIIIMVIAIRVCAPLARAWLRFRRAPSRRGPYIDPSK